MKRYLFPLRYVAPAFEQNSRRKANDLCQSIMGRLRSRTGCITCRTRHVKCDETAPTCGQCAKKRRQCEWDNSTALRIRHYDPLPSRGHGHPETHSHSELSPSQLAGQGLAAQNTADPFPDTVLPPVTPSEVTAFASQSTTTSLSNAIFASGTSPDFVSVAGHSTTSPLTSIASPDNVRSIPLLHQPDNAERSKLTQREAELIHHFVSNLGRWLDCTDATRQFTIRLPKQAQDLVLRHAIVSFSARHLGDTTTAETAHALCVEALIPLLNSENVGKDDIVLCAIVILRVFEQLNVLEAGGDRESHLAGCNALLRSSVEPVIDPCATNLRQAAFWVYVRQCLYNACVFQMPPNVDTNLDLKPIPLCEDYPSALRSETGWANTITYICAKVVHFAFTAEPYDPRQRFERWQMLAYNIEQWSNNRPTSFDPLSSTAPGGDNIFPKIWFAADWHVMAHGFYHLAAMLLLISKPAPKFAVKRIKYDAHSLNHTAVLDHAKAICGACMSAPDVVPSLITLCHTVFIWAPFMTNDAERDAVISLLNRMEQREMWPTSWIVHALREEWES